MAGAPILIGLALARCRTCPKSGRAKPIEIGAPSFVHAPAKKLGGFARTTLGIGLKQSGGKSTCVYSSAARVSRWPSHFLAWPQWFRPPANRSRTGKTPGSPASTTSRHTRRWSSAPMRKTAFAALIRFAIAERANRRSTARSTAIGNTITPPTTPGAWRISGSRALTTQSGTTIPVPANVEITRLRRPDLRQHPVSVDVARRGTESAVRAGGRPEQHGQLLPPRI